MRTKLPFNSAYLRLYALNLHRTFHFPKRCYTFERMSQAWNDGPVRLVWVDCEVSLLSFSLLIQHANGR